MKVLIWFLCIAAYAVFTTFLGMKGITLGGIPTCILVGFMMFVAKTLCQIYDDQKGKNNPK